MNRLVVATLIQLHFWMLAWKPKSELFKPTTSCLRFCLKAAPCDQVVTEGQDVVILAKVEGHPKPMVYW